MKDNFFLYDLNNRLPYFMQSEEGMKIVMELINTQLNDVKPLVDNMPDIMDYDTVRNEFIPLLAYLVSYDYTFTKDRLYQADMIRQMLQTFSHRGNNNDIITVVDSYDNPGWMADDYYYPEFWREYKATYIESNIDKVFRHSISQHSGGHRFQDGVKWWYGVININTVDYLTGTLKQFLDKAVPAGVKYIISPFTDIVGPNGELLNLGPITIGSIVQQISEYDMILDSEGIPKTIEQNGMGLTLIHSDRHKNFTTFYNPDTNPMYMGTYTDYDEISTENPYLYSWETLVAQQIPQEAYDGKGVPFKLGTRTAYKHYAFSDYVTGRLHSGGYITADNHINIDIHLEKDFAEFFVFTNYTETYYNLPYINFPIVLLSDAIEYVSGVEWYQVSGRSNSNFQSSESIQHLNEELPRLSSTFGIDGFEISSEGTYQHIAYANNALGTIDFAYIDSGQYYVGTYWDNVITQANDPQRYAWTYRPNK